GDRSGARQAREVDLAGVSRALRPLLRATEGALRADRRRAKRERQAEARALRAGRGARRLDRLGCDDGCREASPGRVEAEWPATTRPGRRPLDAVQDGVRPIL